MVELGNRGMDDVGQLGTTDIQRAQRHSGRLTATKVLRDLLTHSK